MARVALRKETAPQADQSTIDWGELAYKDLRARNIRVVYHAGTAHRPIRCTGLVIYAVAIDSYDDHIYEGVDWLAFSKDERDELAWDFELTVCNDADGTNHYVTNDEVTLEYQYEEPLPLLMDNAAIRQELGITKAAADCIMRQLPKVQFKGLRKLYVKREDVRQLIERSMVE